MAADGGDILIGVAASGTTPYVVGGLRTARAHGLLTGAITCNPRSPVAAEAEYALEAVVGPEFVTGSTRMKAGTAQKLMLNMISTAVMIRLGRVEGNKMVNMQLTNNKLVDRGTRMIVQETGIAEAEARALLLACGSVKAALDKIRRGDSRPASDELPLRATGVARRGNFILLIHKRPFQPFAAAAGMPRPGRKRSAAAGRSLCLRRDVSAVPP